MGKIYTSPLIIISTFLIISIFFSCSKECEDIILPPVLREIETIFVENCNPHITSECIEDIDRSNVRIQNYSPYEICNIEYTSDATYHFGSLLPGESTCYMAMTTYSYPGRLKYQYADTSVSQYAIDFVGAALLQPGYYNYNLWFIDYENGLWASSSMSTSENDIFPRYSDLRNCTIDNKDDCAISDSKVNLRINNQSIFDFCDFSYTNNDGESVNFGSIFKGDTSCYIPIENIYRNLSKVELKIDNKIIEADYTHPIEGDSVPKGNYTLNITISQLNDRGIVSFLVQD